MDQPHLRDLARNPMQLAILLSLVLSRGASLPDKRTALYDYYIDLFFSREAEKSSIVRNHRELLIDIHRHIAWLLHAEAETSDARATIRQDKLQEMVADYLRREGHDPALAKELFTGMVERVVALVSRVEGTFEFEVQPLREYFAACHLYYTAPQSSPGKERPGSKPDRFDAISRNFYWLNVTRFYAGCYSKGELPSLVERLQELALEDGFHVISYPYTLAATLLSDWVFTQNPRSVQQILELVLDAKALRYALAPLDDSRFRPAVQNFLVLSPRCGREELITRCFDMLTKAPPPDLTLQLLEILRGNAESSSDIAERWLRHTMEGATNDRVKWLLHGLSLGTLPTVPLETLYSIIPITETPPSAEVLVALFRARRLDHLHSSEGIFEEVVSLILDRRISPQAQRRIESPLDALSHALDALRYAFAFRDRQPIPLEEHLAARNRASKLTWGSQLSTTTESFSSHPMCLEFARMAEVESKKPSIEWATELGPWNTLIEAGRKTWGDRWAIMNLATVGAGIQSTEEKCDDSVELLDGSRPLVRRVRYARLHLDERKWWKAQLETPRTESDSLFLLLVSLTWASTATVIAHSDAVGEMLEALDPRKWNQLFTAVRRCTSLVRHNKGTDVELDESRLPESMGTRLAAYLCNRNDWEAAHIIFKRYIASRPVDDPNILEVVQREALDLGKLGTPGWLPDLDLLEKCYDRGIAFETHPFFNSVRNRREYGITSVPVARRILDTPNRFPAFLVGMAEECCRQDVASRITPVASIAMSEGWFATA